MNAQKHAELQAEHTPAAIRQRLRQARQDSFVSHMVLGAVDGCVTTFAVVAGVAGAGLSMQTAIILGLANLVADGFSMAAGNYLGTQADQQMVERARRLENQHIELFPEGEREEIRQIFAAKGFEGDVLEQIVEVITRDRQRWIDTMITEELGLQLDPPNPFKAAFATFIAFAVAGLIPLLPFIIVAYFGVGMLPHGQTFILSTVATAATFFGIGVAKGYVVHRSIWGAGVETLLIGGSAAFLAYLVGIAFGG